ncbi:GNAT family N-acetyltransferase [Halosolutus amylolyticus]|uniref:GNAT family N-acetyltransferase n=1 Tax=Halosolutus amylolyticus TaxID=2932267 RepID=A0ABD5PSE2_9EURY|nr:GNAT family N-acetyltransferase [Halosolutus amylolyticus]
MTRDIREATADDVWAVHETARESWHAAYDDLLGPDRVDEIVDEWYAIGEIESSIADTTGRDDATFLVVDSGAKTDAGAIEADERCHGFAHVVPWPEDARVAYLVRIYVRPDRWGEGIGTALLEHLEAEFEGGFDRLRLAVLADNEVGVSFYESRGFDRVGTYDSDLGADLEEYIYEKAL